MFNLFKIKEFYYTQILCITFERQGRIKLSSYPLGQRAIG